MNKFFAAHKVDFELASSHVIKGLESDRQKIEQLIAALMRAARSSQGLTTYPAVFQTAIRNIEAIAKAKSAADINAEDTTKPTMSGPRQ